jgi:hypothetical protein
MKIVSLFRSLLFVSTVVLSQVSAAEIVTGAWVPPTDPDHMAKPPMAALPVPQCSMSGNISLNEQNVNLEKLLSFLERFSVAAPQIKAFREMQARGEIVVDQLTDYVRRQIGGPATVVATFQYEPREKVQHIFVDFTGDLGVLAIQFYHEMTHSLDPKLREFYTEYDKRYPEIQAGIRAVYQKVADRLKKPLNEVDFADFNDEDWKNLKNAKRFQNDGIWNIEYHAYDAQSVLVREMKAKISCYAAYIADEDKINDIHLVYPDIKQHLSLAYGLYEPGTY